jgi:hypothetical protein
LTAWRLRWAYGISGLAFSILLFAHIRVFLFLVFIFFLLLIVVVVLRLLLLPIFSLFLLSTVVSHLLRF